MTTDCPVDVASGLASAMGYTEDVSMWRLVIAGSRDYTLFGHSSCGSCPWRRGHQRRRARNVKEVWRRKEVIIGKKII